MGEKGEGGAMREGGGHQIRGSAHAVHCTTTLGHTTTQLHYNPHHTQQHCTTTVTKLTSYNNTTKCYQVKEKSPTKIIEG